MNRAKNSDPEVIILSSDSEEEGTSHKVTSRPYPWKPKVSGSSRLSNMSIVPIPKEDKPNQVFKHSILFDDTGRLKVVTKVTQGFTNVNAKAADSTVSTPQQSGCIRESSTSVKIIPPTPVSKNKSPAPSTKVKSLEDDQLDLEAEEWLKKKRKIKCINEGANPPLPLIPLGQPSPHNFHDRSRKPAGEFNTVCEMVRFEKDPSSIEKSCAGSDPAPAPTVTSSYPLKLADMRDVKDLIDACKGIAKDETDLKVVENLRKKMMKIPVDSVADYETTYQEFTQSIRRKVVNDPTHVHVHLKEFLDEVKSSHKSRQLAKQARDMESQPSTSGTSIWNHQPNMAPSNIPSTENKTAAKITAIERRMKVLMMKIEELNAKEISVDEMDEDSAFAMTDAYEKKLMKLWSYLCKLTNRDKETSRSIDAKFRFEGSQYPEINRAVVKLVRKMKPEIPDFNDMLKIVTFCNKKYFFRIADIETINLASDILKMVVEELQRRRRDDFNDTMDVYMHFNRPKLAPIPHDPAKDDPELKAKLDESRRLGKTRTDEVMAHFAQKQEMKEKENPEKAKKEREHGEEPEDDDEDEEESESEYNDEDIRLLIEEDEAKGGGGSENNNEVKSEADGLDERPVSDSEEEESSESSDDDEGDDVDIDDDEQPKPSSPSKKRKLSEPPDGASGLKIISVEGGSLFYQCDGSGREKFSHFKGSAAEDSGDSDVITLD